ncbi:MAG: GT-D fold domain-containing glycosyltransferase [Bdellovibrionales bacterium]|jgi:hypothetical protein
MSLFFRKRSVFGRFPFVYVIQLWDNPAYFVSILKRLFIYKRDTTDYAPCYKNLHFLSAQETLEDLMATGKSLARYSDGEIGQLVGAGEYPPDSDWCQKNSKALIADLTASLSSTDSRLMVAVDPPSTFLAARDSVHSIRFEYAMWLDTRRLLWKYLNPSVRYGHCHLFIKANCPDLDWAQLRDFLSDKDIIIATGHVEKLKHLQLGRRTFFIECGTENAYEKKEAIRAAILKKIEEEKLNKSSTIVFASLGPTAAILAHQMLNTGVCLWDTGHMFEFAATGFIEDVFKV